jgi:anti-sigma regulatory factor (Ser/Thr protein kinase)
MSVLLEPVPHDAGRYRHEGYLYSGMAGFLAAMVPFIGQAVAAGAPVLAMLSTAKIDALRRELGPAAEHVSFADMAETGRNPARLIAAWRRFAPAGPEATQRYGIGEAMFPGRSPAEIAECQLHEGLLNVAFDAATPLWLLCPYDLAALPAGVVDEARRTHPFLVQDTGRQPSPAFRPVDPAAPYARPLPDPPGEVDCLPFERGGLARLRAFVTTHAVRAGLAKQPADALVAAVSEIATNSLKHGGGRGELRVWTEGRSLLCEVSDRGHLTWPLAGRLPPAGAGDGAGLWLANQLSDLVQIHSTPAGTSVRVHQKL